MTTFTKPLPDQPIQPSADSSEKAVIGILLDTPALIQAAQDAGLDARHFRDSDRQQIYRTILHLRANGHAIDCYSVIEEMNAFHLLPVVIDNCYGVVSETQHLRAHVKRVIDKAQLRDQMARGAELIALAQEGALQ